MTSMSRIRSKKDALDTCQRFPSAESLLPLDARVVEWQTRTFEGRMPKGLRVQVPPRAPTRFQGRISLSASGMKVKSPNAQISCGNAAFLPARWGVTAPAVHLAIKLRAPFLFRYSAPQHGIALSHRNCGTGAIRVCTRDCSFQFLRSLVARTDRQCAGEPRQNDWNAAAQGPSRVNCR